MKKIRQFDSGATRDTNKGKLSYEGFLSPRVLRIYAEFMHRHRNQADGKLRAADNWQRGISKDVYMDSLLRHVMELWEEWRDGVEINREAACSILFNTMGLLFEDSRKDVL